MFCTLQLFTLLSALSATLLASAAPTPADTLHRRIVINPPILSPNATTIWKTGQKNVTATWQVPPGSDGYKGTLLLGYLEKDDPSGNEHLFPKPLADNFDLTDGRVTFNIPCDNKIKSRSTYIAVLMGDSGNKSEQFTIRRDADKCPSFKKKGGNKDKPKTSQSSPSPSPSAASGDKGGDEDDGEDNGEEDA